MENRAIENDLAFEGVLGGRTQEKRTALIVFPAALVLAVIIGFAIVAISRMSGLSQQVKLAQKQVDEATKTVEERDKLLREARADSVVLGSGGQGAAVLAATSPDTGVSGVALYHPEQHALSVYAYNLSPPPEGQEYRVVVTDTEGREALAAAVSPDDRGAGFVLARDLPEGLTKVEVAAVPKGAGGAQQAKPQEAKQGAAGGNGETGNKVAEPEEKRQELAQAPSERQPLLVGQLPKPGESGVVMAQPQSPRAQARAPEGRGRRRAR